MPTLPTLAALPALAALLLLGACGNERAATPVKATSAVTVALGAVMPEDAPPQEEAEGATSAATPAAATTREASSCLSDIGRAASAHLVQRCIAVSPATHPPCNAQNACTMIQGEIARSCAMYGPNETRPGECRA